MPHVQGASTALALGGQACEASEMPPPAAFLASIVEPSWVGLWPPPGIPRYRLEFATSFDCSAIGLPSQPLAAFLGMLSSFFPVEQLIAIPERRIPPGPGGA